MTASFMLPAPGPAEARAYFLGWLARGGGDLAMAAGSIPPERWAVSPPEDRAVALGRRSAAQVAHHLVFQAASESLPALAHLLGVVPGPKVPLPAWNAEGDSVTLPLLVYSLGEARFEQLRLVEAAADDDWTRPLPSDLVARFALKSAPAGLGWLLARGLQQDFEHLTALWKIALYWDRVADSPSE